MKIGYFTMPIHPVDRNYTETLQEDREAVILADRLGFSEAYIGEHVTDKAETITSCAIFLATLINETKDIRLGTGTINMPNGHPAAIAAQIAMLDHLMEGRLLFGISPGGLLSDAEVFGNLDANRTEMFVECINQVLAIWDGEAPYNIEGKYWNISTERTMMPDIGQGIIAKPYQQPHPPIIVTAVAPFSKGVVSAAARGWEPISANFLMPPWVASHWPKYVEGCEQGGRPADPANWRVAKSIFVAEDEATARDYARGRGSPYVHYFNQLVTKLVANGRPELFKRDRNMPDEAVTLEYVLDNLVIYGTPEKVTDELLAFREEVGDFGTLLYCGHDWADKRLGRRSMELMAEKVMPAVNAAIGTSSDAAAAE
ncbi:MAG: LLM class flavin-dependent oxidoreductase [Pseudomonadota bacterium]